MPKVNVKIPKGTKCNGGTVCEQDLDLDLDIPEVNPTINPIPQPQIEIPGFQQMTQQIAPPPIPEPMQQPQERTYTNEELSELMPSGVNFAVCKGKNCADSKIQNKNLVTKFKQCPKCGCNNVPKNSSMCPCCGVDEPQDEDEKEDYWEDSDIELDAGDD